MASSNALAVAAYLVELPGERRQVIASVRRVIRNHLPKGYEAGMLYGMIGYFAPKDDRLRVPA